MQNDNRTEKSTVARNRSMSALMKQKISLALGKTQQNRQISTSKKNYLTKERSSSLKSLIKNKNQSSKNSSSVIQKLSFFQQTPTKQVNIHLQESIKQKQKGQSSRVNESYRSSERLINQHTTKNQSQRWDELLWIDSSKRKLKIIHKNVQTFEDKQVHESFIQYCIDDNVMEQPLIRVSGQNLLLMSKGTFYLAKFDQKPNKIQHITDSKSLHPINLNFRGYIFIFSHSKDKHHKKCQQIFSFLIEQIQNLNDDGLKEFSIISKIVKRMFDEKFNFDNKEQFLLLLKVSGSESVGKKKNLDADKLISRKLLCIEKITQSLNLKPKMQKNFNTKKF